MSLPYHFSFWVVAEQKKTMRSGGYCIVGQSLTWRN